MSNSNLNHLEAEALKEIIERVESLVIISVESIRFHAVPEMQNVGDVLETLYEPLNEGKQRAEALHSKLYSDFSGGADGE